MGDMNGVETAIKILNFQPNCKVLLISGYAGYIDIQAKLRARGFDFQVLAKPIPPPELLAKISQILPVEQG
jgi:CheY-like chemotaxis protein